MGKSFKPLVDSAINRCRDEFEQALGKGKTYTDRDFDMFKLGRISLVVELPQELQPDLDDDRITVSRNKAYAEAYNLALRDTKLAVEQAGITVRNK